MVIKDNQLDLLQNFFIVGGIIENGDYIYFQRKGGNW